MRRSKGVYKRGNVWWIAYALPSGKTVRESARTSNLKQAEALLLKRRTEVSEGEVPVSPTKRYTFQELASEYAGWSSHQRFFKTKKYFIRQLTERYGNLPLNSFNPLIIEKYQMEALNDVKPATVNRRITCLKSMFKKACDWGWIGEDTLKRVRSVKLLEEPPGRLRYLSLEEIQTLINICPPHLKPIVITAIYSGMRRGEILSLKWEQVDLKNNFLLLDKTKNNKRREIPINATLQKTLGALPHSIESEYVFVDMKGNPFKDVKRSFATACKRAGIRDFTFHDLRHTFASHLVMAGVDITCVKELMGHKSLTTTLRYTHLAPSHKVKAVSVLEERLGNSVDENNYFTSHLLHNFRRGDRY
ncbi:MAG: tyrosine-type recombinase/integrase [Candidatus Brocadiales bacterium]